MKIREYTPDKLRTKDVRMVQHRNAALQPGCQGVHQDSITRIRQVAL